jgi:hypothetical protein
MIEVSQKINHHQVVLGMVITEVVWMLPGITPTGKRVEIPLDRIA